MARFPNAFPCADVVAVAAVQHTLHAQAGQPVAEADTGEPATVSQGQGVPVVTAWSVLLRDVIVKDPSAGESLVVSISHYILWLEGEREREREGVGERMRERGGMSGLSFCTKQTSCRRVFELMLRPLIANQDPALV